MTLIKKIELHQFIKDQPSFRIKPSNFDGLVLEGNFKFQSKLHKYPSVTENYDLQIRIPSNYPNNMIEVEELNSKIPKLSTFHINPDSSFCLGSPFKLKILLSKDISLNNFIKRCLIPYLYAISLKLNKNIDLIFGELAHGNDGLYQDYQEILGLNNKEDVKRAFILLSIKKRVANKKTCACGCNKRLGKCDFRFKLYSIRKIISQSWFKHNMIK